MRLLISLLILTSVLKVSFGQPIETNHPDTLKSPTNNFSVKFSNFGGKHPMQISNGDTVDAGTDGRAGLTATIYYGNDSLIIENTNFPYFQVHYIAIKSPNGLGIYRLHFNNVSASFSQDYMNKHSGKAEILVPEVYELANMLLILSPSGQKAKNMDKQSDYYKKVMSHFTPFLKHPVFKSLDFPDSLFFKNYYDFRENSFCFIFEKDKIVRPGPYYFVMGGEETAYSGLFKRLIPEIEDFAKVSEFRSFYKSNSDFYQQLIEREGQLLPLKNMCTWIEKQFPKIRFNSYKVVFSPIIRSTHSTQRFASLDTSRRWFNETIMFVSGPSDYDRNGKLTEKQREGLLSGIVFTEIDHNYVNPTSDDYAFTIDSVFSNRALWTLSLGDKSFYSSAISVFNEYMTHALFSLYVLDNFETAEANFLIEQRESLMVEGRGFSKFKEFNQMLVTLRNSNKLLPVASLYPLILNWCKKQ